MFDAPCTHQQRKQPMLLKQRIAILLLSLLALASPYAMPRASAMQAAEEGGAEEERIHQEKVNSEIEAFRATQLSLRQAMRIAEQRHSGAAGQRDACDVDDARTGDVGAETASHLNDLNSDDRNNVIALRTIRQELADAVVIAEQVASGKAIGGGLMDDNGKLNFIIVVVSGISRSGSLSPTRRL